MKVIFYGNRKGNIFDKLIRWWTSPLSEMFNGKWKDSYSHVEILFSDGLMFSASQYENQTRYKKHNTNSNSWKCVELNVSKDAEDRVRAFCDYVCGNKYDYMGVLGFVFFVKHEQDKWFCSEVCSRALKEAGLCLELVPSKTSPNALYKSLGE